MSRLDENPRSVYGSSSVGKSNTNLGTFRKSTVSILGQNTGGEVLKSGRELFEERSGTKTVKKNPYDIEESFNVSYYRGNKPDAEY
jgi:hypothetical protein